MNDNKYVKMIRGRKLEKVGCRKKIRKDELVKQANLDDDRIIKRLEKQLKLNKRKKKSIPKSFVADGLDYLLNFCLEKDKRCITEVEKLDQFESELTSKFNENLADKIEANACKTNESYDAGISESKKKNSSKSKGKDDDVGKISQIEIPKNNFKEISTRNKDLHEDIYGRKRDNEGNIIYDANARASAAVRASTVHNINLDDENLRLLKRQLKGCLNRVTEHNMHSIANQIEEMYMTNSRNNMNCILAELMLESLVSRVITPARLVSEHMMLIAILHSNIGIEVGANFLEKLVKKFVKVMENSQDVENKELDNVVLMISYLYNFKVFGHKLLYQILDKLMIKFTEKEIELILLILKTVGFSLRKDDPHALRVFIQNLQEKANREDGKNSRVRFMLEVLLAIKNNNISKIPQYDPSDVEHLKKVMKSVIRQGNTVTRFNVSLEDLLHADENGKWWIVGSAWSRSVDTNININLKHNFNFGKKILELAQKQRMNTDTRKNIFCILMTAEDYLDAFEKLHRLDLKDKQEGEIIHVLMHCCLQENKYNPFYAVLAQKFCEYNRKYQLTIQYATWDKLKTLKSYRNKQLNNFAQLLTHLFIEKCLAISILKVIQFTELEKHTMQFLRQILLGILGHKNELACIQVFERISVSPQLQTFRESLRLFINCFLVKNVDSCSILDKHSVMLKKRAESVDKILISHGSKVVF
ncbi:unnamed protein product [Xylocopa violacea]|uniref:MI domain-containing protein n=2 Tax=Xylocopa violacea TaxID=135666 RepID=A0ABP1P9Z3_XYLVO